MFSGWIWSILDLRSQNWDMEVLNFDRIWIAFCWIFCHYLLLHQKNRGKHSAAWMLWLFGHIHVEWHGFMNGLKTGPNSVSNIFQPNSNPKNVWVPLRIDVVTIGSLMKGVPKWTWCLGEWTYAPPVSAMFDGWFASKKVIYNQQNVWCSMFFLLGRYLNCCK